MVGEIGRVELGNIMGGLDQNLLSRGSYVQAKFNGIPLAVNLDSLADIAVCSKTLAEQFGFEIHVWK